MQFTGMEGKYSKELLVDNGVLLPLKEKKVLLRFVQKM